MTWIIGNSNIVSWSAARDKVRLDLWRKGSTAIPDDVVDRALHASILDIESRRKWVWLENVSARIAAAGGDFDYLITAADVGPLHSVAVFSGANPTPDRLELVPLPKLRSMQGSTKGIPSFFTPVAGGIVFDCIVPNGTEFEIIYQAQCPEPLPDAIATPPVTLSLHQQAVLAGAKALVALEFLHDDDKAARNSAAFERHIQRMEDKDDLQRGSDEGGTIQPYTDIRDAAFGPGWSA